MEGDTKAAAYPCDPILGQVAGSTVPPADDRRVAYTEDAFVLDQHEREEGDNQRRLIAGNGACNGA